MAYPSFSAVIPAFNAQESIGDAVRSLRGQSPAPTEILVVDDGSTDDTAARGEAAGARVITQANAGPGAARNTGIAAATSEWVALMDADDVALPDRFATQVAMFPKASGQVAVLCGAIAREHRPLPQTIDFPSLWAANSIATSTVILRKEAWDAVGRFDESRALIGVEDYNLWLRLSHAGWGFLHTTQPLIEYLPTSASLSRQTQRFAAAELMNIQVVSELLDLDPKETRAKRRAVLRHYAGELFHFREMKAARSFYANALRIGPLDPSEWIRFIFASLAFHRGNA